MITRVARWRKQNVAPLARYDVMPADDKSRSEFVRHGSTPTVHGLGLSLLNASATSERNPRPVDSTLLLYK